MTTTTTANQISGLVPGTWTVDPAHSEVSFTVRHMMVSKVRGSFKSFDAELIIADDPLESSVNATVDVASFDTGNADRDAHVRSAELLDVERRPTMSYRSTEVRADGDSWTVDGEPTIGTVTRPLTLAVELGGVEAFFDGTRHAGFEATGEIRRKDFDLGFGPLGGMLGDVVKFELDLEFIEPT